MPALLKGCRTQARGIWVTGGDLGLGAAPQNHSTTSTPGNSRKSGGHDMQEHLLRGVMGLRRGFTSTELMAVALIVIVLAAICVPIIKGSKQAALRTGSLSNVRQLGAAVMLYAGDHDDTLPALWVQVGAINGGDTPYMPPDAQLRPYTAATQIWRAPADHGSRLDPAALPFWDGHDRSAGHPRSYAIAGNLYTASANGPDANTGIGMQTAAWTYAPRQTSQFEDPSRTVLWAESWVPAGDPGYVGGTFGSVLRDCDAFLLGARMGSPLGLAPCKEFDASPSTPGYGKVGVYGLIDGSAKSMPFSRVATNDFEVFKVQKD